MFYPSRADHVRVIQLFKRALLNERATLMLVTDGGDKICHQHNIGTIGFGGLVL